MASHLVLPWNWGYGHLRNGLLRTLVLCLLLEKGRPFYMVIQATQKSSRLQGEDRTFISQLL